MPKVVDHALRRREIAAAVARIARERGLRDVSFREVAAEAGVSVSLVQHYFGTMRQLLIATLDIQSADAAARIGQAIGGLGPDPKPVAVVRTVAGCLLAVDQPARDAMLVYLGFAAAALTNADLRRSEAFANAEGLRTFLAEQIAEAQQAGDIADDADPDVEAHTIVALVLGLSFSILLDQAEPALAATALDAHVTRLER